MRWYKTRPPVQSARFAVSTMSASVLRWWKRFRNSGSKHTEESEELSQRSSGNPYVEVQPVHLFALPHKDFPPIVLGNMGDIDARRDSQTLQQYEEAKLVDSHYNSYVGFRQGTGWGLYDVIDDQVSLTAPTVTMQVKALLIPTGTVMPSDADDWYIGILQVMLEGKCSGYYGRTTDVAELCNELYFSADDRLRPYSSDLPLLDRITGTEGNQQRACDDDPAFSSQASSPAKVRDVYAGKQVYCQLLMSDTPSLTLNAHMDMNGSKYYLNKVEIKYSFRTMVCVYKRGFGSNPVIPLQAVDWYFNATAFRHPTHEDQLHYDVTPFSQPPFKVSSFARRNIPPFDSSCLSKKQNSTFESPNSAMKWYTVVLNPPQKICSQETCV